MNIWSIREKQRDNKVAADDARFWSPWNVTVDFDDTSKADLADNSNILNPLWSCPSTFSSSYHV